MKAKEYTEELKKIIATWRELPASERTALSLAEIVFELGYNTGKNE